LKGLNLFRNKILLRFENHRKGLNMGQKLLEGRKGLFTIQLKQLLKRMIYLSHLLL